MRSLGVSLALILSGLVMIPFWVLAAYAASVLAAALMAP
jgi:hypothetical protein